MKNLFLLSLVFILGFSTSYAQCTETKTPKILLVGDSWAFFMGVDQTLNTQLKKYGHSNFSFYTNATLAENGAETDDFLTAAKQDEIVAQLNANPDIKVVHLSIGGNDFLGDWNVNFTQAQEDSLSSAIRTRLLAVIDFIKNAKPGVEVFWSGYTYPNFEEVIEDFAPFQTNHPFYGTWEGMGFPTFAQLNHLQNKVAFEMSLYASGDPNVSYVPATGILQYTFGQNTNLSVPPGGSYAPGAAPLPFGFVDYPSPKNSMRNYLLTKDCFHLSPEAYNDFIGYQFQKFYQKFLMEDQYILAENNPSTASVTQIGSIVDELVMGQMGIGNVEPHLTFNTTALPDTNIVAASIFLRIKYMTSNEPFKRAIVAKVINGKFGSNLDAEGVDYTAQGDAEDSVCVFGAYDNVGEWVRFELPPSFFPYIKNNDYTQIMLNAVGLANDNITFYDATDPEFAPILNLTFEKPAASLPSAPAQAPLLSIYPNPATHFIHLDTKGEPIQSLSIHNSVGQEVTPQSLHLQTLEVVNLPTGVYNITIQTAKGIATQKWVKE